MIRQRNEDREIPVESYTGILRDNHIEWTPPAPPHLSADGVRVQVTLLGPVADAASQGRRMAAALAQLAATESTAEITDPMAWERTVRQDRELPGRD
jgi:hypothetical protein